MLKRDTKIFCIGANKTGTTSLMALFDSLNFVIGEQTIAESYLYNWAKRDFDEVVNFCKTAEFFQDIPFSYPDTYKALDKAYPGSKFILTVRSSSEEWYESLVRFHSKVFKKDRLPTAEELKNYESKYCPKGFYWDAARLRYGVDDNNLYDRKIYIKEYERHNAEILEYFKNRPNDLIVINLAHDDAIKRLLTFVGLKYKGQIMPHANKSKN